MSRNESSILFGKQSKITLPRAMHSRKVKMTPEQWLESVMALPEKLEIATLNYTIAIRLRAQKLFSNSFKYNRFQSEDSLAWEPITDNTWHNRQAHTRQNAGLWGYKTVRGPKGGGARLSNIPRAVKLDKSKVLREFGFLRASLTESQDSCKSPFLQTVFIDRKTVMRNPIHREARGEWALWHNTPSPGQTYGKSGVPFKQRRFMGHTTYITGPNGFIRKYEKRYLFDQVFGV